MTRLIDEWIDADFPEPKPVAGAIALLNQIDKRWPERSKKLDGWFAGEIHHERQSDHNPCARGVVHAIDIDENLLGEGKEKYSKKEMQILADQLIEYVRKAVPGSERIKYVIYDNKIASGTYATRYWVWRSGNFGCTNHLHVSFTKTGESDKRNFSLSIFSNRPKVLKNSTPLKPPKYPGKLRLMFNEQNESVRKMQRQLISKGYDIPEGDSGLYNVSTKEAVKSLYHKMGKRSDGLFVGPAAWTFLFKE